MVDEVYDGLRVTNIIFAAALLVLLLVRGKKRWRYVYTEKLRLAWLVYIGTTLFLGESALENLLQDNAGGPRVVMTTQLLVLILMATLARIDTYTIETMPEGNDTAR